MESIETTEETLTKIEVAIRHLKIQYDMFFSGHQKRQPFESRKEVETMIEVLGKVRMQRFADRFRYNSIASKYQTMVELWTKMIRAKEEGRLRAGIPGFVEPIRRRQPAMAATAEGSQPQLRADSRKSSGSSFDFTDPATEDGKCRMFYDEFIQAKGGNSGGGQKLPYTKFREQIQAKASALKNKSGCETVRYSIEKKEGRVVLKVRPRGTTKNGGDDK
jgi:hypothetical protein